MNFLKILDLLTEDEQEQIYRAVKARKEKNWRSKRTKEQRERYNAYMRNYNQKKKAAREEGAV